MPKIMFQFTHKRRRWNIGHFGFKVSRFQDLLYNSADMYNKSKHNNIIQYINIENMGDREGIYFRLIHYIQYTFNI